MPSLPIERGRPGPGLLAQVLVAKYCDHTPLHRQAVIYAREGVELDRSTLADWVGQVGSSCSIPWPRRSAGTFAPAPCCMPTTPPSRCWRPAGKDQNRHGCGLSFVTNGPLGSEIPPAAYYRYSPDRMGIHAQALLGTLPWLSSCRWLCRLRQSLSTHHAQRRADAGRGGVLEPRTPEILRGAPCHGLADRLGGLGAHRRPVRHRSSVRGRPSDQRGAPRASEHARPRLVELKTSSRLPQPDERQECARRSDPLCPTRWHALLRYLTDGRLEMRTTPPSGHEAPVLGRKNYLFCGSDAGGQRAACVYTIVETAKMCSINPQAYLSDVLNRIADHPIRQIDTLLPWRWSK